MKKRIIYIVIALMLMIPAALTYAGSGLLSGFPSSATEGDTVTFTPALSDEESGSLEASVSPSSGASLSVSGDTIKVTFSAAGSYTVSVSAGDRTDSCTVTVEEAEDSSGSDEDSGDDGSGDDSSGDDSRDDSSGEDSSGDKESDKDGAGGKGGSGDDMKGAGNKTGGKAGMGSAMKGGAVSVSRGGSAAGGQSAASSGSEDKTTYTGSADNYLESLSVKGHKFSQAFHKTNDTYFITLKSGTDRVKVSAEPSDSDAQVVITGTEGLSTGRNKIMVSVTAENGDVRVYRIYADVK